MNTTSSGAGLGLALEDAVPAHVPASLVYDFDIFVPRPGQRDLIAAAADASQAFPKLFFTPRNGGHWVLTGFEALSNAARHPELFSSRPFSIPTHWEEAKLAPLTLDPPEHTKYRTVLNAIFTPKAAVSRKVEFRDVAINLIKALNGKPGCEFVTAIAELFPVSVFLKIMGLPTDKLSEYRKAAKVYLGSSSPEERTSSAEWIMGELAIAIAEKQAKPADDAITAIINSEIDGAKPSPEDVMNLVLMIFLAGLDTVTTSLSYGIRHLAEDQELQARVRENPALVGKLTEELLRRYSAAQPGRTLVADIEFQGVQLKSRTACS